MNQLNHATATALVLTLGLSLAACGSTTVHGDHSDQLTLVQPANQTLTAGETNTITLLVSGQNAQGPYEVDFDDLPEGVSVVEDRLEIPPGDNLVTFTLYADHDAEPVRNHVVRVEIESQDGIEVSDSFQVDVVRRN